MNSIDHLGIAVRRLEEGLAVWSRGLGLQPGSAETVAEQGVRTVMLPVGESRVELLEPTGPDTPVGRFLDRHGPGIHHVCFRVDDLPGTLARLEGMGLRLIDREPRLGAGGARIAFLHPSATGGVLVELKEAPAPERER